MLKLARWSTTHRKYIVIGWVVLLIVVNVLAQSAGTSYSNNFTLPNSDAQRAANLLQSSFPAQAGDRDTIVFKVSSGSVRDPAVRGRMEATFARSRRLPHVTTVVSPYTGAAAGRSISANGKIAFATVVFDEKANLLPKSAPEGVVRIARAARARAAGGARRPGHRADRAGGLRDLDRRGAAGGDHRAAADVRLGGRDGAADRRRRWSGSAPGWA